LKFSKVFLKVFSKDPNSPKNIHYFRLLVTFRRPIISWKYFLFAFDHFKDTGYFLVRQESIEDSLIPVFFFNGHLVFPGTFLKATI
jgi:hypothetical protein